MLGFHKKKVINALLIPILLIEEDRMNPCLSKLNLNDFESKIYSIIKSAAN